MKVVTTLERSHFRDNFGALEDCVIIRCFSKDRPGFYFKQIVLVGDFSTVLQSARYLRIKFKEHLKSMGATNELG